MNKKEKRRIYTIIILLFFLFIINYSYLDKVLTNFLEDSKEIKITRIIDGDTIVANKTHIRLLGINTPERGEKYYEEAKQFLKSKILNESVTLKFTNEKQDRYGRTLAYIFYKNKNINLEIVEKGFANYYFPSGKDIYYDEFSEAWKKCLENEINLCKSSENICADCIKLNEFNSENQKIILENSCSFSCNLEGWSIKDEGRKKFVFEKTMLNPEDSIKITSEDFNEDYVWTDSEDTLFLRDEKENLVLWSPTAIILVE